MWCSILSAVLLVSLAQANPLKERGVNDGSEAVNSLASTESQKHLSDNVYPNDYTIKLEPHLVENDFTFSGESNIDVIVNTATNVIVLHAAGLQIDENFTSLVNVKENTNQKPTNHVLNTDEQTLTLSFEQSVANGAYTLNLKYTGTLKEAAEGFYRRFRQVDDKTVWEAFTAFKPSYARRAFPCFDETDMKARFTISIKRQKNYEAKSTVLDIKATNDEDKSWTQLMTKDMMSPDDIKFKVVYVKPDVKPEDTTTTSTTPSTTTSTTPSTTTSTTPSTTTSTTPSTTTSTTPSTTTSTTPSTTTSTTPSTTTSTTPSTTTSTTPSTTTSTTPSTTTSTTPSTTTSTTPSTTTSTTPSTTTSTTPSTTTSTTPSTTTSTTPSTTTSTTPSTTTSTTPSTTTSTTPSTTTTDEASASSTTDEASASSTTDEASASSTTDEASASSTTDEASASSTTDEASASSTTDEASASSTTDASTSGPTVDASTKGAANISLPTLPLTIFIGLLARLVAQAL